MTAEDLIEYLLKHSQTLNPTYTKDKHLIWVMGFLASIAIEKNHMDNIVWARVKERVNNLYDSNNM